jgi:hypothetical protein
METETQTFGNYLGLSVTPFSDQLEAAIRKHINVFVPEKYFLRGTPTQKRLTQSMETPLELKKTKSSHFLSENPSIDETSIVAEFREMKKLMK